MSFQLPGWVPRDAWEGYEEMRRVIGKRMTDRARQIAVNKLEELVAMGYAPDKVLDQSVFYSWQGLFPIKESRDGARDARSVAGQDDF